MRVFEYAPQWGMEVQKRPSVSVLNFGDGYEQRIPKGINNKLRTYSVSFVGSEELIGEIEQFLDDHGAVKAFLWTPYNSNKQSEFKCEEWSINCKTGYLILSAEFKEVVGSRTSQPDNHQNSECKNEDIDNVPDLVAILNTALEQLNG